MTIQAGTRLAQISTSGSAAQRLRQAAGVAGTATAAALLIAWSGLASATAAEHLLHERVVTQASGPDARRGTEFSDDDLIDLAVSLIISGVLDG